MHIKTGAATIAALFLGAAGPAPRGVEALAWLSGKWEATDGARWTEEHWSAPRGGMMIGGSRSGAGGRVSEFEFLRIAEDEHGFVTYWASPGGRAAVGFRLTEADESKATFENPENDYPKRISYRREGRTMTAVISGANGANPQRWTYRRRAD